MITRDELLAAFAVDLASGQFSHHRKRGFREGAPAGSVDRDGYTMIQTSGRKYFAHRLVWLVLTGAFPDGEIDHINGDRADNRAANLRVATRSQNLANAGLLSSNTSGRKGVSFSHPLGRWKASITVRGRQLHLGFFETVESAHQAYCDAAKQHFGEFARAA